MTIVFNVLFCLVSVIAGCIQGTIGFGAGIICLIFLPHYVDVKDCVPIVLFINLISSVSIYIKYRKHIVWKQIKMPLILTIILFMGFQFCSASFSTNQIKLILDIVFIILSLYNLFEKKETSKMGLFSKIIIVITTSFIMFFLGIGGPLMSLYFLKNSDNKEEYLGEVGGYFVIINVIRMILFLIYEKITIFQVGAGTVGIIGVCIGMLFSSMLIKKINDSLLKTIVYSFIGIYGLYDFLISIQRLNNCFAILSLK